MSVLSVNNLQETFVGKNLTRTLNAQVTDPNAAGYIVDGEVVVVTGNGIVYDTSGIQGWGPTLTATTTPWIQIVQRNGDNLVWSNKIYGDKLIAYRGKSREAGREQIYHIGYNGSSGSLDITAGLDYQLTLIENQDDMMWAEQKKKNVTSVTNNLVNSQQDLAEAIVRNVMRKYNTDGLSVTAAMLNNAASGAVTTQGTTLAVTHGSNVIVYAAAPAVSAAGTVLRIGATGSTYQVTDPVYIIQGAHPSLANAFILDQPYAGPSNSVLAATAHGYIGTPGANWGVRFTGKALTYRRDFFKFKRTAFTLQLSGFGATVISKSQDMAYGSGDGRLVLEEESFSKGFQGALNRMSVPLPIANETFTADPATTNIINTSFGDAFTTVTTSYDTIVIEHFGQDYHTVVASPRMPQMIKIFMYNTTASGPNGAAQGKTGTLAVQTALNDWMNSTPSVFPVLSVFA
jgi:hypothetical protein